MLAWEKVAESTNARVAADGAAPRKIVKWSDGAPNQVLTLLWSCLSPNHDSYVCAAVQMDAADLVHLEAPGEIRV